MDRGDQMTVQQPDGAVRSDAEGVSGVPATPAPPTLAFTVTGIAQSIFLLALATAAGAVIGWGFSWITAAPNLLESAGRALAWTALTLTAWELAAIVGKWLLVGRVRPGEVKLWSLKYLRRWAAALLVQTAPAARLVGSEWQRWHLNACGARIGRGTLLLCATPGVPDMVRIGTQCLVGERTLLAGYRPAGGRLVFDRIRIGDRVVIGDDCLLEPGSVMGDQARLAPSSSLQPGQKVPADRSWHGSPARPLDAELPTMPRMLGRPRLSQAARQAMHAFGRLAVWLAAMSVGAAALSLGARYLFTDLLAPTPNAVEVATAVVGSAAVALCLVLIAVGCAAILRMVPRMLSGLLTDSRTFPVPSWRWALTRLAARCAGQGWTNKLLGGSMLTRTYLARAGWRFRHRPGLIEAFGHQPGLANPLAVSVGAGTIVGDQFRVANVEYAFDSFRFRTATIGTNTSIGDQVTWPSAARVGEDCLVATRTAVPLTGPIRSGIGLQGSPAVEMPRRSGEVPALFDQPAELGRSLASRIAYDRGTLALRLLASVGWLTAVFALTSALILAPLPGWMIATIVVISAIVLRWISRLVAEGLARMATQPRPMAFSILDPRFGRHQRVRKLGLDPSVLLNGTPLRPLWWRLRGAEVGRCVFDDGVQLSEPSLVSVGDQVELGLGSTLQAHQSQDVFYSTALVVVGERSVIGNRALLIAGTQLGADTVVAGDTVLFGETGDSGSGWLGNPGVLTTQPAGGLPANETNPTDPAPRVPAAEPRPHREVTPAPAPVARKKSPRGTVRTPKAGRPSPRAASTPPPVLEPGPVVGVTAPEPGAVADFRLLGTSYAARRVALPAMDATVGILDLTGTPLRELNLPQALAGFGIPEECLEDDLSLRDAPISASQEIRSLLARVLLRQLLSTAHPEHEPSQWGFIRSSGGGLEPFWPATKDSVAVARSDAVVVAAIAAGPLAAAVVPAAGDIDLAAAAAWLNKNEHSRLTHLPRGQARDLLPQLAAVKKAAAKAVGALEPTQATQFDALSEPGYVAWNRDGSTIRLRAMCWSVTANGVVHWVAVVRPAAEPPRDDLRGVIRNGRH